MSWRLLSKMNRPFGFIWMAVFLSGSAWSASLQLDLNRNAAGIQDQIRLSETGPQPIFGQVVVVGDASDVFQRYSLQISIESRNSARTDLLLCNSFQPRPGEGGLGQVQGPNPLVSSSCNGTRFTVTNLSADPVPIGTDGFGVVFTFDIEVFIQTGEILDLDFFPGNGNSCGFVGVEINNAVACLASGLPGDLPTLPALVIGPGVNQNLLTPQRLEARPGATGARLEWSATPGFAVTGYNLYRMEGPNGENERIAENLPTPYFLDTTVARDRIYLYQVSAVGQGPVTPTEGPPSKRVSVIGGAVEFQLPDVRGSAQGKQIRLPIGLTNAEGISDQAFDLVLEYPSSLLEFDAVQTTLLTQDFAISATPLGSDRIHLQGGRGGNGIPLFGAGSLVDVVFLVNPSVTSGQTGTFRIESATLTDVTGVALFPSLEDTGSFTVAEDHQIGDVNGDTGVNDLDALAAVGIAVRNLNQLTGNPFGLAAADINADLRIDAADAILVQRLARSLPINPPTTKSHPTKGGGGGPTDFSMVVGEANFVPRGSEKSVPVEVYLPDAAMEGVAALDMEVSYNPELVDFVRLEQGEVTQGFTFFVDYTDLSQFFVPGTLRVIVSGFENQPPADGEWCRMVFRDKMAAPDMSESPVVLGKGDLKQAFGEDIKWDNDIVLVEGRLVFGGPTPTPSEPEPTPTLTPLPTALNPEFDGDGSGIIDELDFLLFIRNWMHRVE